MKTSLFITLIALTTTLSTSLHARPPSPPTFVSTGSSEIVCNDLRSINIEDLMNLPNIRIVSYNIFTNTICTTGK